MPPRCLNQRVPTACDTPTATAAFSLVTPVAICAQNRRSTARRCEGAPGERIGPRPVNACIHFAGLPINTSVIEVLLPPVESTQFTCEEYQQFLAGHNLVCSMSAVGHCGDNAAAEGFFGMFKREHVNRWHYRSIVEARADVFDYIERFHNPRMQQRLDIQDQKFLALTQLSAEKG